MLGGNTPTRLREVPPTHACPCGLWFSHPKANKSRTHARRRSKRRSLGRRPSSDRAQQAAARVQAEVRSQTAFRAQAKSRVKAEHREQGEFSAQTELNAQTEKAEYCAQSELTNACTLPAPKCPSRRLARTARCAHAALGDAE